MSRDAAYEWHFLKEAEERAERRFGIPTGGYRQRVAARLKIGSERYGDDNYLKVDVVKELLEETPDIGAYCVLEAQKQVNGDIDDSAAWHLLEAAIHGAAADYHARMARRPR